MSEVKHTPGPWTWLDHGDWHELVHYIPGETFKDGTPLYFRVISDGSAGGEYGPDIDVNGPDARMIAAAPDLYAACERLVRAQGEDVGAVIEAMDMARAAISKAKGELE